MKAMILAAGLGSRLAPFTDHTPKPLFPIHGRPLIGMLIRSLADAGCTGVAVNLHHLAERIEAFLRKTDFTIPVTLFHEPDILGTGGGIRNARTFFENEPFIVVNGDVLSKVDFRELFSRHKASGAPATLVLCDHPEFNTVLVDPAGTVAGFAGEAGPDVAPGISRLTFTGIQALSPEFFDYLPPDPFASSIDAFRNMIADGRPPRSLVLPPGQWTDIGTPERYREAALAPLLDDAFSKIGASAPETRLQTEAIAGGGSDRKWFRLSRGGPSVILCDHGIRPHLGVTEADAFIRIGRHLKGAGAPVAKILSADAFSGLVIVEDLGNDSLESVVRTAADMQAVEPLYRSVIDRLVSMWKNGAKGFNPAWAWQSPEYDRELILEKECRYFLEAFYCGYLGKEARFSELEPEFNALAARALENGFSGFLHRDFQSRNILIKDGRPFFIDYQGGRTGPLQYDLASLLIDPYASLSPALQDRLLDYAVKAVTGDDPALSRTFRDGYRYLRIARNLQILGAFAFLSRVKQKPGFKEHIPAALASLRRGTGELPAGAFPLLSRIVENACNALGLS